MKNIQFKAFREFICLLLILCIAVPMPAYSSPPSVQQIITPTRSSEETDEFLEQVAKREKVVGRTIADATVDPYRISPENQWIEVQEKDGTLVRYLFSDINQNARRPKENYQLGRDVKVVRDGDLLRLEFGSVNGKDLRSGRVYSHVFHIPGIRDVLKDDQHVYLLLENGDILTIFMAHAFLFNANRYGEGGEVLVPFIDAVSTEWVGEDARLLPGIHVQFFDHIEFQRGNIKFPDGYDVSSLRKPDIIILDGDQVVDVVRYQKVADSLSWHIAGLKARFELMNGNRDLFDQLMDQAVAGRDVTPEVLSVSGAADRTLLGRSPSEFLGQGDAGLGMHHVPSSSSWSQVPWEKRRLQSSRLTQEDSFVHSVANEAANPDRLSTYDRGRTDVSPEEFARTMEGQISSYIETNVGERLERKVSRWSRLVKSTRSLARYVGKRAALVTGIAAVGAGAAAVSTGSVDPVAVANEMGTWAEFAYNGVLRLLPAEVANSKHFFTDFMNPVKAFNLPFVENEPVIGYGVKWGILTALVTMGIGLLPKLVLSRFDEKVLGEVKNKKGFVNGSFVGLAVYMTWTSRFCARILQSQRSFWTRKVDSLIRKADGRQYLFEDQLEARRMGISTELYSQLSAGYLPSTVILEKLQQASAIANRLSLEAMLRQLIFSGVIEDPSKVEFSITGLKAMIAEWIQRENIQLSVDEVYERITKRTFLLNSRIYSLALEELAPRDHVMKPEEITDFANSIVQDSLTLQVMNENIWDRISEAEMEEVEEAMNRKEQAIKLSSRSGNNNDFYKYRNGVVSETIVRENTGFNFFIDMLTQYPLSWTAPDYSDLLNPKLLVASDGFPALLGIGSGYFAVEVGTNAVLWGAQVIPEQEVWAREMAGQLVNSYYQPEMTSVESRLTELLEKAHPATLDQSAARYNRAYLTPAELSHNLEKLSDTITIGELKGYRLMLTIVLPAIFIGYALGADWSIPLHSGFSFSDLAWGTAGQAIDLGSMAAKRLILVSIWAYTTYRIWWKAHYTGLKYAEGHVREDAKRFKDSLYDLIKKTWEFESAPSDLEKDQKKIEIMELVERMDSFYEQSGKEAPSKTLIESSFGPESSLEDISTERVSDFVSSYIEQTVTQVPFPMAANQAHKILTTIAVGGITTVKGLIGFAFLWKVAGDFHWWQVGAAAGGLYTAALATRVVMRGARAYFGYQKTYQRLDKAIRNFEEEFVLGSEKTKRRLFKQILKTREMYRYFDKDIPSSVLDLEALHPDSENLLEVAKTVRAFMLSHPPVDPNAAGRQLMGRFIKGQSQCVEAISSIGR